MLRSDRRKRQTELKSTISAGRLFHTFTMRQAKKWYLIFVRVWLTYNLYEWPWVDKYVFLAKNSLNSNATILKTNESLDPDDHSVRICSPELFITSSFKTNWLLSDFFTQLIQRSHKSLWLKSELPYYLTSDETGRWLADASVTQSIT